jgi:predicted transcriptional regulator
MARDLWAALGLTAHVIQLVTIDSAREAVRYILGLAKLKLAVGMWMWWSERNKIREEGKRRTIYLIVKSVECYVGEITQFIAKEPRAVARRIQKWQKPAH